MIRAMIVAVCALNLSGCDPTCDGDDQDAVAARVLSQSRLEQLYNDAAALLQSEKNLPLSDKVEPIPDEFKDLGASFVRVFHHTDSVNLRLRGCMDHHLDLNVLDIQSDDAKIVLRYGEHSTAGSEILWRRSTGR